MVGLYAYKIGKFICQQLQNFTVFFLLTDPQTGTLTLSGEKLWVTNGNNVDIFIVWAKQISKYSTDAGSLAPRLTAVLVDAKNSAGITIDKDVYQTRGLKGCGFTSVKFNNVSSLHGN